MPYKAGERKGGAWYPNIAYGFEYHRIPVTILRYSSSALNGPLKLAYIWHHSIQEQGIYTMLDRRIAVGSDHAGYEHKERVVEFLQSKGYMVTDYGTKSADSVDYPDYAVKIANAVGSGEFERGIIVCGSGIGVSMVANKVKGVRAANCLTAEMAVLARDHNDANVLTIGQRLVAQEKLPEIITAFLDTPTSGNERHIRRVQKIHSLTEL